MSVSTRNYSSTAKNSSRDKPRKLLVVNCVIEKYACVNAQLTV